MTDRPGTLLEKLESFRAEHYVTGVEYDEKKLRAHLGMPPVENPEFLATAPGRRRLIRLGDTEAERELQAEMAKANDRMAAFESKDQQLRMADQRIAELERQLRDQQEARGTEGQAPRPAPPKPDEIVTSQGGTIPAGQLPNDNWTVRQIVNWNEEQGYPNPPKRGVGMTKRALLEYALGNHSKAQAPA